MKNYQKQIYPKDTVIQRQQKTWSSTQFSVEWVEKH